MAFQKAELAVAVPHRNGRQPVPERRDRRSPRHSALRLTLRDPTPIDWATSPLEALSVLVHPHPVPYEHWFQATLRRGKDRNGSGNRRSRRRRHRFSAPCRSAAGCLHLRGYFEGAHGTVQRATALLRAARLIGQVRANIRNWPVKPKKLPTDLARQARRGAKRRHCASRTGPSRWRQLGKGQSVSGGDSPRDCRPP